MNRSIAWCLKRSTAILTAMQPQSPRAATPLAVVAALSISLGSAAISCAQVVQLPSQHVFSNSGSVLVPDGGTADFGGIGRSSQGAVQSGFGPLSNRASGSSSSGSTMSVSVRIIDLEALDEAILAGAAPRTSAATRAAVASSASASVTAPPDRAPTTPAGSPTRGRVGADPGQWQRVLSGGSSSPGPTNLSLLESNIRYYVQQGERAERAGSLQAARVYYQLARKAMTPELEERYQRVISARTAEAAARLKAEQEAVRRKF